MSTFNPLAWFRKKKKKKQDDNDQRASAPSMPTLPKVRARPLTAVPPSPEATANSALFQRLPPEIRRYILTYAFGNQTMHLDMRLQHPRKRRKEEVKSIAPEHANSNLPRDTSKPAEWQWRGSICHRTSVRWDVHPRFCYRVYGTEPWNDRCHDLCTAAQCSYWPGEVPEKCFVGVMGWLLTCRQAYSEGIEVLYATNQFHIRGTYLLRQLPDLLLASRLAAIRTVELLWDIHPWSDTLPLNNNKTGNYPPDSDMRGFCSSLEALPRILRNLEFLFISLQGWLLPPAGIMLESDKYFHATENLLLCIDGMVRKLTRLTDCRVALPWSCYNVWKLKTTGKSTQKLLSEIREPEILWRDVPVDEDSQKMEAVHHVKGYWICLGEMNVHWAWGSEL
ncbi:hypothetical protein VTO42DRAFT_5487 [Malbranchea cinnamomea]